MKKRALITGVNGQDGSYLAEYLIGCGYDVIGTLRSAAYRKDYLLNLEGFECVEADFTSQSKINDLLLAVKPTEIYNFAAYSSGSGMFDDPIEIAEINGVSVARILEGIVSIDSNIRFCQASSSEMFGFVDETPQSENTRFNPRTPYGAAKLYAHNMVNIYRKHFGVFACSAILYNHESPRRGLNFVTRKIVNAAVSIKNKETDKLTLGALDVKRDWGFSEDYVKAMHLMLQYGYPDDYVIASGVAHTVRDICQIAFDHLGLDYRKFVEVTQSSSRAPETLDLVGDSSKAREILGWKPSLEFAELIRMMVDAEIKSFK
ncbi:GDP-mannose 4,6-dehydratase [Candidatus Methylopumilus rimovensis]|jgi:GDPmannose 4,6-dehydratase|uniref:GDP-mannose 4,6-dehydratase n=1 Tax=Candidatus Methylopumilus rimovensis TaxID=2588535 RepID=UPI0011226682|nr:GDP-mannose 4,6-dehydratase [Candidatus Methylopumilus rimovensis]QDD12081.1 GDP-mannose 4,6-dehydratase [Candidatus Methylopumilus rimovensis]